MSDQRNSSPVSQTDTRSKSLKTLLIPTGRRQSNASFLSDSSASNHGFRHSVETVFEKIKGDGQYDDDQDHGIKKLVPKRIKSKHRKKKFEREEEEREWQATVRDRSIGHRRISLVDGSDNTLMSSNMKADDDAASTLTYESETETDTDSKPLRPVPLVSHPSHIGYLTTTSPAVQSSQLILDDSSEDLISTLQQQPLAITSTPSLTAPADPSARRSTSPAARIRDALSRKSPDRGSNTITARRDSKDILKRGLGVSVPARAPTVVDQRRGSVSSRLSTLFPARSPATTIQPISASVSPTHSVETLPSTTMHRSSMPAIVNTPPTPVDTSIPNFPDTRRRGSSAPIEVAISETATSSQNTTSHKRGRTNSTTLKPSKLSNSTAAPLTPTIEQTAATPTQSGFFSSVISAAQNAASTLTNTIGTNNLTQKQPDGRSRSATLEAKVIDDVEVESVGENISMEEKEPAVKTMGSGDLNLSHLGIIESPKVAASKSVTNLAERGRSENKDAPMATLPRAQTANVMLGSHDTSHDHSPIARPRSVYGVASSPPRGSTTDLSQPASALTRSGSVRSSVGGVRRKRNSSAATAATTTGTTIIPATTNASGHQKMAGFAVASKKRNHDFHEWFRSVPDDDYLIEDYSCALQREILAHGRLYVSEGHLCFSSNILGWATTLVMSFDEIVAVEKRNTAMIFRNGLEISTLHAKHVFASFTSRDSTYDLIVGIWKLGHPALRSSLNGVSIEETGGGDRTEKVDGTQSGIAGESDVSDDDDDDEDVYDEDDDASDDEDGGASGAESIIEGGVADKVVPPGSRKVSAAIDLNKVAAPADKAAGAPVDFPGPVTHAPTTCQDQDTHYEKCIADEVVPAPLGKIYNLVFGPASADVMSKWLTSDLKCLELQWEDRKALDNDHKTRSYNYIKPLFGAIGPKSTKCFTTEVLDFFDLEKAVSLTLTTQTPDVPSGNVFSTKTKYCLSWAEGGNTRFQAFSNIEWTGKSWLKAPIEKGANEGMVSYTKDLCIMLRAATTSRSRAATNLSIAGKKGKKGKKSGSRSTKSPTTTGPSAVTPTNSWGILEPVRPLLEPITSIFSPLLGGNTSYILIALLLVFVWYSGRRQGRMGADGLAHYDTPQRIAAYEEMWRREESELWEWLEERVGLDRINKPSPVIARSAARSLEERMRGDRLGRREIEEAIQITEEKLRTLKGIVKKGKPAKASECETSN